MKQMKWHILGAIIAQFILGNAYLYAQDIVGAWQVSKSQEIIEFYQVGNTYNAKMISCKKTESVGHVVITGLQQTTGDPNTLSGKWHDVSIKKPAHCKVICKGDELILKASLDKAGVLGFQFTLTRVNQLSEVNISEDIHSKGIESSQPAAPKQDIVTVAQVNQSLSDVDINIPTFNIDNSSTFAVIIAREENFMISFPKKVLGK